VTLTAKGIYSGLDTLCCPLQPKDLKNAALALMRDTYRKANSVLVLDLSSNLALEEITGD
jgi:hypothetical protein